MTTPGRRAASERPFPLPVLTRFDGDRLEAQADYDAVEFVDGDFTGQDARAARFLDCRLERCAVDGLSIARARVLQSVLVDVHGARIDLADSTWRDARISGGRLGAVTLTGASWTGVEVLGSKLGFLNLAGAEIEHIVFEGCEIGSLDARGARLRAVSFVDCSMDELYVAEATLSKVDLSGLRLRSLVGVDGLRGAIVSREQLLDLAPMLAAQLGLEVRPGSPGDGGPSGTARPAP